MSDALGETQGGEPLRAEVEVLERLLRVHEEVALEQARALEELQAELARRNAALARSNAELEQFAYVVSHDLQEPLRMVASFTQLLARRYRGRLDADADEVIGYVVDGAARMKQLIEGLLTYSRVQTRAKPLEPTDSETALGEALDDLRLAVQESGAVVTHDPLPLVVADRAQLRQLLQNLLANAIKFRRREEPLRIQVSCRRDEGDWRFSVTDNGIGIEPRHQERIFLIFQRLHTAEEYPGTGIGLAVCKRIVERHGGRIWVESAPGKGATFHFTLPANGGRP